MCDVLIGKEIIHGGSHRKVICSSMDNKLVEEVHGVDFRELNWHVQFFDIQRRCCCGWNSFFLFRNFPLESHKKIAVFKLVLTGGAVLG